MMDERYRRLNMPTFDEWLEDVRSHANERGDHTRQRHVERVERLLAIEAAARNLREPYQPGGPSAEFIVLRRLLGMPS